MGSRGVPSVQPDEGTTVWGALWLVPAAALEALDELAGVAVGCSERTTRRIVSPAGPRTEAMMYVGLAGRPDVNGGDSPMADIIEGAKQSRLPAAYIKELQAWAKPKG